MLLLMKWHLEDVSLPWISEQRLDVPKLCLFIFIYLSLIGTPGQANSRHKIESTNNSTEEPMMSNLGTCNLTSHGEDFANGFYGSTMLRPLTHLGSSQDQHLYCTYTFLGTYKQRIMFHVKQLTAGEYNYASRECQWGFLRLWDGLRQPGRYPYPPNTLCGDYETGEMSVLKFSTQMYAEVEFYVERFIQRSSFTLTYKYVNLEHEEHSFPRQISHNMKLGTGSVCNWIVALEECEGGRCDVISPGYPGSYPPNMECRYHIFTENPTSTLKLIFQDLSPHDKPRDFDIRRTAKCKEDYIEVYDGNSTSSLLIGRFCGKKMPDITASGGQLFIYFVTGPDTPPYGHNGFHATAITLTKEFHSNRTKKEGTWCDWTFEAAEGSVSSPDHWLPKDTICSYKFSLRPGMYLEAVLTIYGLQEACKERIEVYESNRMVDRICESRLDTTQPRFTYNLTADPVTIKYITHRGQYQSAPDIGFWVSFRLRPVPRRESESVMLKDEMISSTERPKMAASSTGVWQQRHSNILIFTLLPLHALNIIYKFRVLDYL